MPDDIVKEAGLPDNWEVVDHPPVKPNQFMAAPTPPNAMGNYFQGSISPTMQHDAVFVGTQYGTPRVPNVSLMPLSPAGVPSVNASIKSGGTTILNQTTNISGSGNSGGGNINWKGDWVITTNYAVDDMVQFNISTYLALIANSGVEPDSDPTKWVLVSKNINLRDYTSAVSNISFVQGKSGAHGTGGGAESFTSNNTAGNFIIVLCSASGNSASPLDPGGTFAVSDSQGNVYTKVAGTIYSWYSGTLNSYDSAIYIAYNINGGANTVTLAAGGITTLGTTLKILEYSGAGTVNPFVSTSSQSTATSPSPSNFNTIGLTTDQPDQTVLLYAILGNASGVTPAGFSDRVSGVVDKKITGLGVASYIWSGSNTQQLTGIVLSSASHDASADTYYPSDVVIFNGTTYICIQKAVPGTLITDTAFWAVLAEGSGGGGGFTNPMTTLGDIIYEDAVPAAARLAGNTSATKKFLAQTGTGAVSAAPEWDQVAAADLSDGTTGTGAIVLATSPTLLVSPRAPTQATGDSSTLIATDAFVATAIANALAGTNPTITVDAATAAILPNTPTYSNGTSGVGATLTSGATNVTLVVDGYTPALNDRILVKNQGSAFQNGIYYVSVLAALGVAWVLTRALNFNTTSSMNHSGAIPVVNGTVNETTQWVLVSHVTTIGSDALNFTEFSADPVKVGQGITGVSIKTINYSATAANSGLYLIFNSATAVQLTLPSSVPTTPWFIGVINIGAGLLTIDPGGHNLNGSAATTTLKTGTGTIVVTDFSNYFAGITGLSARTSTAWTTASLVNNAVESSDVTLAKTILVVSFTVDRPSRVRLYSTNAARDADVSRTVTTPVAAGTENEVIMDVVLNNVTGLSWVMSPAAWGSDGKSVPDGSIAYNVTNLSGSTSTVTVTMKYIALEG